MVRKNILVYKMEELYSFCRIVGQLKHSESKTGNSQRKVTWSMSLNQAPCHCFTAEEKCYVTTGFRCLNGFIQVVQAYNLYLHVEIFPFFPPDFHIYQMLQLHHLCPSLKFCLHLVAEQKNNTLTFCPLLLSLFPPFT